MRYLSFMLVLFALFTSCKKETTPSSAKLVGQWELKSSVSGMNGQVTTYPGDLGNVLVLGSSTYKETRNNEVIRAGNYAIKRQLSLLTNKSADMIIYDNPAVKVVFAIDGDMLSIYPDVYDGGSISYRKMK